MYIHVYIYICLYICIYFYFRSYDSALYSIIWFFCPIQILPYCIYPYPYCMLLLWSNNSKIGQKNAKKKFFRFFSKYTPNTFIINSKIFFPRRIQNSCRKGIYGGDSSLKKTQHKIEEFGGIFGCHFQVRFWIFCKNNLDEIFE